MRLHPRVADALADRILGRLVDAAVMPGDRRPDWRRFHQLRERVRSTFEVPETSITPIMARVLFGIASMAEPRRVLGIGTYCGNALVWLTGPGFGPGRTYTGDRALGVDTDAVATGRATANFAALGPDAPVELMCEDGHRIADRAHQSWDLVFLDADDRATRKDVYASLLQAIVPVLSPGAIVLAHDICVPKFRDSLAAYQCLVRAPDRFATSVSLEIDPCGLEVSKAVSAPMHDAQPR